MEKQRVIVNIFNEQYALKSDLEENRIQKLAEQVDQRMRRNAERHPNLSSLRVAVLVALELADEAQNHKDAYDNLMEAINQEQDLKTVTDAQINYIPAQNREQP